MIAVFSLLTFIFTGLPNAKSLPVVNIMAAVRVKVLQIEILWIFVVGILFLSYAIINPIIFDPGFLATYITFVMVPFLINYHEKFTPHYRFLILASLSILYLQYFLGISTKHYRFSGTTYNPNQLALYLFFLFTLAVECVDRYRKFVYIIAQIPLVIVVASDALIIAIIYFLLANTIGRLRFVFLLILPVFWVLIDSMLSALDEGGKRIDLLLQAIERFRLLGNGPDYFLGSLGDLEVHNLFLDIYVQFGFLGVMISAIYFMKAYFGICNGQRLILFEAFILFNMFHYYARNPLFWIIMGLIIQGAKKKNDSLFCRQ